MRLLVRLFLLVVLSVPGLSGCVRVTQDLTAFDQLARWVPGDAQQIFFLDLKLGGEAGTYWTRIRAHLETNPQAKTALEALLDLFRVQDFDLEPFIVGPAVNGYLADTQFQYLIFQVNSQSAARDAVLLLDRGNAKWEREDYQGQTLYHGLNRISYGQREWLALTTYDDLLMLVYAYDRDPIDELKALVSLPEKDSLASLPSWKTLRERLPETPLGLLFFNIGDQLRQNPPHPDDTSLGTALGQQIEALALVAVPEKEGMRVEIFGTVALQHDVPPEIGTLLNLPGVDPASWAGLPADTAIFLTGHSAPTIWPVLKDILSIQSLDLIRDTLGLDLEADLFGARGPLSGDFALALTPPLPDQPISQGVAAGQVLFMARDASQAQMDALQIAMEGRGAVLSPQRVDDLQVQTQVGTEPTGYAISFGFDDDQFLLGTSPGIIDQSVSARRNNKGLVRDGTFCAVLNNMSHSPSFFAYLNRPSLTEMAKANMSEGQYEQNEELYALEAFDGIGLGLNLDANEIDGTLYFYIRDSGWAGVSN
jgi:hypothetical protein